MAKSIAELKGMQRTQLNKLNKDVLIESILSYKNEGESQMSDQLTRISQDLAQLRHDIASPDSIINRKLESMQSQIDRQAEVIKQQQLFLETIDRRERETKLVVLGVPDEAENLEGAVTDEDKLKKIWEVMREDFKVRSHRRLGRLEGDSNRKRPILVEIESRGMRDGLLSKTRGLKEKGQPYDRIYVKKDVHPNVRKEWKRLRDAETAEKNRPENVGYVIRLDTRERKLYRDSEVIDQWNATPF